MKSSTARRRWGVEQRALAQTGSLALPQSPLSLRYRARVEIQPKEIRLNDLARRVLNVSVALIGLTLTAPLMLVIAIAVRLSSPGPVIFRQERVGQDRRAHRPEHDVNQRRSLNLGGRIFVMYKFRTMRVATGVPEEQWSSRRDPRITPIGHILRATRLDELPQFVNVLRGDMNIVGPRPETPGIFQDLKEEVGKYQRRQTVLPGITGLAQIQNGYDTDLRSVERKVSLDLEYIRRRSAIKDFLIMVRTVPIMIGRKVWR